MISFLRRSAIALLLAAPVWSLAGLGAGEAEITVVKDYASVTVFGFEGARTKRAGDQPVILRHAAPAGDIRDWISKDDPSIALLNDNPGLAGSTSLILRVSADGRVEGCEPEYVNGDRRLIEGLCDRIAARARFVPAISPTGEKVSDAYDYLVGFGHQTLFKPPARFVTEQPPPPVVGPSESWPSYAYGRLTAAGLPLLRGGYEAPKASSPVWAGVVVRLDSGTPVCKLDRRSGDPRFDAKVCQIALKASYSAAPGLASWQQEIPILFVSKGGKPMALLPIYPRALDPSPLAESWAAVAATPGLSAEALQRGRVAIGVDATGGVADCTITETTGDDASDVLLCAQIRALARFRPGRDVFGRPAPDRLYGFSPSALAR